MQAEEQNDTKSGAWRRLGQASAVVGVLVAIIGIGVSSWLSLRTEARKTASLLVLSSQPFVLSEPNSSGQFQILYKDSATDQNPQATEIANPWLTSLRLINTGNTVIEQSDIVDPLEIEIQNAHVVQARLSDDGFGAKPGNPTVLPNKITLDAFFLNPRGYLTYDLITDGKPLIRPPDAVIREMADPIALEFSQEEIPVYITAVPLSNNVEMTLLVFSSLLALSALLLGFAGAAAEVGSMRRKVTGIDRREFEKRIDSIELGDFRIFITTQGSNTFAGVIEATTANNMQLLKESISKRLTMSDRMALDDIANEVSNRYKNEFREELARTMYLRLPSSIDVNMRRRISEMDIQGLTLEGFLSRVKQLAKEQIASESKVRLKDFAGLAFAALLIIFATASGIVTGGSWRNLLGL